MKVNTKRKKPVVPNNINYTYQANEMAQIYYDTFTYDLSEIKGQDKKLFK